MLNLREPGQSRLVQTETLRPPEAPGLEACLGRAFFARQRSGMSTGVTTAINLA